MPRIYNEHTIKSEDDLQIWAVHYLRKKFPSWANLIDGNYHQGAKISAANAGRKNALIAKSKAMGQVKGRPDLIISIPNWKYNGLAIELKKSPGGAILKTKNQLASGEHVLRQAEVLGDYCSYAGFLGIFSEGYEQTKYLLDWYFDNLDALNAAPGPEQIVNFETACKYFGTKTRRYCYRVKL